MEEEWGPEGRKDSLRREIKKKQMREKNNGKASRCERQKQQRRETENVQSQVRERSKVREQKRWNV